MFDTLPMWAASLIYPRMDAAQGTKTVNVIASQFRSLVLQLPASKTNPMLYRPSWWGYTFPSTAWGFRIGCSAVLLVWLA